MNNLMCHVVAGYPTPKACLELLLGLQKTGVAAIEAQIPFSDPIADGETIMRANDVALADGMTTAASFDLIAQARQQGLTANLYIMSYLQKVHHFGTEEFCRRAADCQASGLIIPDLPFDSPDFAGLHEHARKVGLTLVLVLSPGMSASRLQHILKSQPPVVYVTTQRGITGNQFSDTTQLQQFLAVVKKVSDAQVMVGFGIATLEDVSHALQLGDIAIIGSAIIKKLQSSDTRQTLDYIGTLVKGSA